MNLRGMTRMMAPALALVLGALTGCESTDGGGSTQVSGSVYYGTGFYDPWYYGGYYPPDVIVTPPPSNPGARPSQPIAKPLPSIPSTPRPMPVSRVGGRR